MADLWVLDSFAVLALLGGETGSEEVSDLLRRAQQGTARVLMNWVNAGEVAYIVERQWGKRKAYEALGALEATQIEFVAVDRALALRAAALKASHPLAYADAFAAALAMQEDGVLMTGDPAFEAVGGNLRLHWLQQEDRPRER